jgi:hypothetical protein
LSEEQQFEAAVKKLEEEAAAAVKEEPSTRSQRSITDQDAEVLAKRTEVLEKVLRKGADPPSQCAARCRGPVQELFKQAKNGRQAAVVAECTREVPRVMPDAREWDDEVLDLKSSDYMLE